MLTTSHDLSKLPMFFMKMGTGGKVVQARWCAELI